VTEIRHRHVESASGLRMHIAEAGTGPLVVLLHGFPECWYSWRHQLVALAGAGFHAVAPDQRGYARTGGPARAEDYTILHLVGDVVGLIDALGEERAVVAGHDWGAPVAWGSAQMRPDRVRGVVGLSGMHRPRTSRPPVAVMRERLGEDFYIVYFQQRGVPEAEFDRDRAATFRRLMYAVAGEGPQALPVADHDGVLSRCPEPDKLPGWLTEDDIDTYVREFESSGFTGPLNWYRSMDRSWELTAAWHRAPVTPPALYVTGDRDPVANNPGAREAIARMSDFVPNLRDTIWLPGCGHWIQQERPAEVNQALTSAIQR
jgi:pimeloyl-ACP methyl ester carboxylesterase